jgi:ferritin
VSNFKLKKSEFMELNVNKKALNEAEENELTSTMPEEIKDDEETKEVETSEEEKEENTEEKKEEVNEGGLYKLSQETISELTDRIKDEYTAHYFYVNASNWCRDMNYKKATAFFEAEAVTELEHAKGVQDYMTDFNIIPVMPSTETKRTFTSLPQIIREAYKLELDLMMKYNETSSKLFASDLTTFDFLQTYRVGQKESVVEYNDLINALDLVNENDKFQVLYFEQTYL